MQQLVYQCVQTVHCTQSKFCSTDVTYIVYTATAVRERRNTILQYSKPKFKGRLIYHKLILNGITNTKRILYIGILFRR